MRGLALAVLVSAALSGPAWAEPWGSDYHMGTFIAFGGSDAEGRISLECGSLESGHNWGGEMSMRFTPAADSLPEGKIKVDKVFMVTGTGPELSIPVRREDGDFVMRSEEVDREQRAALVHMLASAGGVRVMTATIPFYDIADMSLQGSANALMGFEDCTQGE